MKKPKAKMWSVKLSRNHSFNDAKTYDVVAGNITIAIKKAKRIALRDHRDKGMDYRNTVISAELSVIED